MSLFKRNPEKELLKSEKKAQREAENQAIQLEHNKAKNGDYRDFFNGKNFNISKEINVGIWRDQQDEIHSYYAFLIDEQNKQFAIGTTKRRKNDTYAEREDLHIFDFNDLVSWEERDKYNIMMYHHEENRYTVKNGAYEKNYFLECQFNNLQFPRFVFRAESMEQMDDIYSILSYIKRNQT